MIARCANGHFEQIGTTAQVKPAMRRVALIYNPASGQYSARRKAAVGEIRAVLREAGVEAEAFETGAPGQRNDASQKRRFEDGYDTVLACGGDGTVHEVVQSLVGTDVALGRRSAGHGQRAGRGSGIDCIAGESGAQPARLGTGTDFSWAHSLCGQSGNPGSRYFIVAAGVGADALLMSRLDARLKRRLGYVLYLIEAFRIWATSSFPLFEADLPSNGNGGGARGGCLSVAGRAGALVRGGFAHACSGRKFAQWQPEPAGVQDAKPAAVSLVSARGRSPGGTRSSAQWN